MTALVMESIVPITGDQDRDLDRELRGHILQERGPHAVTPSESR